MGCCASVGSTNSTEADELKRKKNVVIPNILTEKKWIDQEVPQASVALQEERKMQATVKVLGVESNEYQYLIIEDVRCENYQGFSLQQPEIIGRDDFIQTAIKEINARKDLVATHAIGVGKCHIKNLKDVQFKRKEGSATVLYAKVLEEFHDGTCLFQLENCVFTTVDGFKNRGRADLQGGVEDAITKYKQVNQERNKELVACFGLAARRLVWKLLPECKIEVVKDMNSFLFAKKAKTDAVSESTKDGQQVAAP